jgi:hypothetical protein
MRGQRVWWIGGLIVVAVLVIAIGATVLSKGPAAPASGGRSIVTEADFRRAMQELSNWGRWGPDDELGASNLITPAKRRDRQGGSVGLARARRHPGGRG